MGFYPRQMPVELMFMYEFSRISFASFSMPEDNQSSVHNSSYASLLQLRIVSDKESFRIQKAFSARIP